MALTKKNLSKCFYVGYIIHLIMLCVDPGPSRGVLISMLRPVIKAYLKLFLKLQWPLC